jgi:hypothetical protein
MSIMMRTLAGTLVAVSTLVLPRAACAQSLHFPLEAVQGLRTSNVIARPATLAGKRGVRIVADSIAVRGQENPDLLATVERIAFSSGVIEVEVAGAPAPGASEGGRGFVGIAFRLQPDGKTYDAFYLRPTNGRAEDQERRNHATQYVSHPEWPWHRLRRESPSRYEAYVDLQPDVWTKIRIEVRGDRARLYVHDQPQPTLIVNDLKSGPSSTGAVALWIGPETVAHFRNLTVTNGVQRR